MIKYYFQLLIILSFSLNCYSQVEKSSVDSGFEEDSNSFQKIYSEKEIIDFITKSGYETNTKVIGGSITNIFYETVDSVKIYLFIDDKLTDSSSTSRGLFRFPLNNLARGKLIELSFNHPDYHPIDTTFIYNSAEPVILFIKLNPRQKISVRGRVYAGSMPLEGVKVDINSKDKNYQMVTRGCFYDKEDYWNCLYDGMFKQDLTFDNPSDSIQISLSKEGMKPLTIEMPVKDFTGEIMEIKMKYTVKLPDLTKNNLSLKLGFPLTFNENEWFIDLAYYRSLRINNFNRLSVGLDGNMLITNVSVSDSTFPGLDVSVHDSTYISGFLGPSFLFWVIAPQNRYFSTYIGLTAAISLNQKDFTLQPFIGTRVFLDLNKAISLEVRHVSYDLDVVHFSFNPYGDAHRFTQLTGFNKFVIDLGIQILF